MRSARIALLVVLLVAFALAPQSSADRGREYIKIQELTMSLEEGDAVFTVSFALDPFAKIYVLALGTKYIEPDLMALFSDFENVAVAKTGPSRAVLVSKGAGEYRSGYYLYDSKQLGSQVPKLTVVYPERLSRTFYDVSATPSVFSEA
ncbi:MAG: hypothetical protein WCY97_09315 [Methanothrix sp.]|nr:MAG: hypothetical protein APR56_01780 [Methanosaeta sp. SDB]KQC16229.1 MAG: hypothetical protein APR56_08915 [Methanosaeta sp. SDB]MDD3709776.1 hypothetical protein [Methanothrix sp.]MDD5768198.1 hypothetical protein [Methanothrix sp.]MDI9398607.1 hypothetical protein [Euryarchaeota archaeon]